MLTTCTTTGNKHKGDVMERREQEPRFNWTYEAYDGKHGIFEGTLLIAVVGECFARSESARDVAQEVVRVWNEHDALVEQRDSLASALSELADLVDEIREGNYTPDSFTTQPARIALATVEQGGEL